MSDRKCRNSIPKPAFPRPDRKRENWLNLNGEWDFSLNSDALDGKIVVPYSWTSPLSGVEKDEKGTGYYRRSVSYAPKAGNRLFLIIGASDYTTKISVNGSLLNTHQGGYNEIETEVTSVWKAGGENEIYITAEDNREDYQTYGKQGYGDASGIWQTVWLEERPAVYIESWILRTSLDGSVTIDYKLNGGGGRVTAEFGGITASSEDGRIAFRIDEPKLWSPDEPNLCFGTLTTDGGDRVETYFGIREVGMGKFGTKNTNYITLNGKPVYINATLDQSYNPDGYFTLPTNDDEREEIERMKRLGLNAARIHIKSEEPLKLYWADVLGLLIIEDIPNFWGEPNEKARALFEKQMWASVNRDINHPSVFYWVIFNETWGLFTRTAGEDGKPRREYTKDTQEWVRRLYRELKAYDPTRLVEDNSPCNRDHVETDVNSWHFYSNGYEKVKKVCEDFVKGAYPGSEKNYIGGNKMADVPIMNSECGNVWGIKGSAGDSDLSWHYRYMLNEFRIHGALSGFVFTEFHDVINEFNGYYRIDNTDKIFGYEAYVPGMTIRDLHSKEFMALDCPPCRSVKSGEDISVPLVASNFSDRYMGQTLTVEYALRVDEPDCSYYTDEGSTAIYWNDWGAFPAGSIDFTVPESESATATLEVCLCAPSGETIMRNFTTFDINTDCLPENACEVPLSSFKASGFEAYHGSAQGGNKLNGVGRGEFSTFVKLADIPGFDTAFEVKVLFEASSRALMTRDLPEDKDKPSADLDYMHGCKVDRSANRNAFFMTDEYQVLSSVQVLVDGVNCGIFPLADCPADSRGLLSWHYQAADDQLDEAGSYGYLCEAVIPSRVAASLKSKGAEGFTLTFKSGEGGLSLFGRRSGRYPAGVRITAVQ